ncbi:MAG: alpha/beta hydrolase [Pseudomonadales bacterium]|nr:alpha/beta hydrolase [Pseudomonadales bacterium]
MLKKVSVFILTMALLAGVAGYSVLEHFKFEVYELATELGTKAAGLTAKQVKINDHTIHYLENSRYDKPTLVLIHGFGAFKENWIQFAIELKDQFHIIIPDLPGHGRSSFVPTTDYGIDYQAEQIHQLLIELNTPRVIMAGNSMGGAITALFAARYPHRIEKAVLMDPASITDIESEFGQLLKKGNGNPLIVETPEEFAFMIDFAMSKPPFMPWFMADVATVKMAQRKSLNDKIWADITGDHDFNFKNEIARIKAPTLISWGKEDRVLHYKNAFIFDKLIANSKLHIFEGVGHAPMLEVPQLSAKILMEFSKQ